MIMPQCLEVVTALRRLNSIDLESKSYVSGHVINLESLLASMELSLVIDFFESRGIWLDSPSTSSSTSTGGSGNNSLGMNGKNNSKSVVIKTLACLKLLLLFMAATFNSVLLELLEKMIRIQFVFTNIF